MGKSRAAAALEITETRLHSAGFTTDRIQGVSAEETLSELRTAIATAAVVGEETDDPNTPGGSPGPAGLSGLSGVVVLGGDGMVNIATQALAGTEIPLGIIPLGTGNDTARTLGLPLKEVSAAVEVIVGGTRKRIDLALTGGRYYVTVLAAGFDAAVNERANRMAWPPGRLKYTLAIVAVLAKFRPIHYRLELDGDSVEVEAMLVSIGNGDSMGGGLRITHGADLADGLLDVVVFTRVPRMELIKNYPKLFSGGHTSHPAYVRHRVTRVTVAAAGVVVAYADGERIGELPIAVEVVPAALTVFVPRS